MSKAEDWFKKKQEVSKERPSLYVGDNEIAFVSEWELEPAIFFMRDMVVGRGMDLYTARKLRDFLIEVL